MLTGMCRCCVLEENVCKIWNGEQEKCDALKYNSEMFEETSPYFPYHFLVHTCVLFCIELVGKTYVHI